MTPKNREELEMWLSVASWCYDNKGSTLLSELDAAGLAIVPKEPTEGMKNVYTGEWDNAGAWLQTEPHEVYRAMLEASPYRGKE